MKPNKLPEEQLRDKLLLHIYERNENRHPALDPNSLIDDFQRAKKRGSSTDKQLMGALAEIREHEWIREGRQYEIQITNSGIEKAREIHPRNSQIGRIVVAGVIIIVAMLAIYSYLYSRGINTQPGSTSPATNTPPLQVMSTSTSLMATEIPTNEPIVTTSADEAIAFVHEYYNAVSQQDFDTAFSMLSDCFRLKFKNSTSYAEQFTGTSNIQLTNISTPYNSPTGQVIFFATLSWWQDGEGSKEKNYYFHVKYESNQWKLNGVLPPGSNACG